MPSHSTGLPTRMWGAIHLCVDSYSLRGPPAAPRPLEGSGTHRIRYWANDTLYFRIVGEYFPESGRSRPSSPRSASSRAWQEYTCPQPPPISHDCACWSPGS
eukprot:scaffold2773_cov410-Prasinococcus_capsulatus_cf.AAC.5